MSDIPVKIPDEIRQYKEKVVGPLSFREFVFSAAMLVANGITFYIGKTNHINDDLLGWIMIGITIPFGACGWLPVNNMPFEKFVGVVIDSFRKPVKRKFHSENFYNFTKKSSSSIKKKDRREAGLEKAYLLEQADKYNVDIDLQTLEDNLLTVRKFKEKETQNKGRKKNQNKVTTLEKLKEKVDKINEKKAQNPQYVLNKKESIYLKLYMEMLNKKRKRDIEQGKKKIKKKVSILEKRRVAKSNLPKTSQDSIPYLTEYDNGMLEVEAGLYSIAFELSDINYLDASDDEQDRIFLKWGEFLNYFPEDIHVEICIDKRVISRNEMEQKVLYKMTGDKNDVHRQEYNKIMQRQMVTTTMKNNVKKYIYIVLSIKSDNPYEAELKFNRISKEVIASLQRIDKNINPKRCSTEKRLEILHDKFRWGKEGDFGVLLKSFEEQGINFYDFLQAQGLSAKDYIAPDFFGFDSLNNYFQCGDSYARCVFLNNLPASLLMENFSKIIDVEFPLLTSIHTESISKDKALKLIKQQLNSMEKNIQEDQKRALNAGYNPEFAVNHDTKQKYKDAEDMFEFCKNRNQNVFFVTIGFMIMADSLDNLDNFTNELISKARKFTCQIQKLNFQQEDAFRVIMPMGIIPKDSKLALDRTLTTESTSLFLPLECQELFQEFGFYYGLNAQSLNMILCDRTQMKTPSGFILGSSGSGKSFATKREMINVLLQNNKNNLFCIDPENEYGLFCRCFGGVVLSFSTGSDLHINPLDMNINYGLEVDEDPESISLEKKKTKALKKKTDYLMSLMSYMISDEKDNYQIKSSQKSVIDRAIKRTYEKFLNNDFDSAYVPTLKELQNELDKEKLYETGAANLDGIEIAESCEYFTRGSMDLFSYKTNVNLDNRFIVFNIRDLGKELRQVALLIILDFIWNQLMENSNKMIRTYCYVDEVQELLRNDLSATYLEQLYSRGRKYGLVITGITQDVATILASAKGRKMLNNSDFILMLNQKKENLEKLASLLEISDSQLKYIFNSDSGSGLLFAEKVIIPFMDRFPEDSYLYSLISTKFDENNMTDDEIQEYVEKLRKQQMARHKQAG